jgi:hypothetical protein
MANDLVARLDKRQEHILCGSVTCGGRIARVLEAMEDGQHHRFVIFPLGWEPREQDRVWALTRYAARQKAGGHSELYRREANWTSGWPREGSMVTELPARATCPRCGFINVVDPRRLNVEPRTRQGPTHTSTGIRLPPPFVLRQGHEPVDDNDQP